MDERSAPPGFINYRRSGDRSDPRSGHPSLPRWAVLTSLVPIPAFVVLGCTHEQWSRAFHIGQGWERHTGVAWLATAASSVVCLVALFATRKRWDGVVAMALHALMVAFTVFPGQLVIPWLMHWTSGPGA